MLKSLIPLALLALSAPALAEAPPAPAAATPTLQQEVEALLATAPQGTRFGLMVVDEAGRVVVAVNPDQRFIPASNTKMFTTAAAYARMQGLDRPDTGGATWLVLEPVRKQPPPKEWRNTKGMIFAVGLSPADAVPAGGVDAVLYGRGDARMSSAPDCKVNCLAALADAVAGKTKRVRDVVGDDSFWPDQRWSPGMSWNNIGTDSGTAVSALNLDDNELRVTVTPGAAGQPPKLEGADYYTVVNEARTVAPGGKTSLVLERPVNGMTLRLRGDIPADAQPWSDRIGIDDPAHYAAWTFKRMLEARGVKVTGKVRVFHRLVGYYDQPRENGPKSIGAPFGYMPFAELIPPPLAEDMVTINKVSQNLHAQVLFRRLGDLQGTGSEEWSVHALYAMLDKAGVPRAGYDFSDGSGMSTYNRVSPRAAIALLRWIDSQPWGAAWYASLPIAGRDGTLKRRFIGTPLEGNLTAKTGTLNATNALSGTFRTASGRRFTFAFFANDVPNGASVLAVMEAVLVRIAAAN